MKDEKPGVLGIRRHGGAGGSSAEYRSWAGVLAAAVVLSAAVGCANPMVQYNSTTGVVSKKVTSYSTGILPAGWRHIFNSSADLAFYNDRMFATISVNAVCPAKGDPPLRILLNHLMFGFTDRQVLEEKTLMLDGREALRAVYTAKLDGIARKFLVYILKKDNCIYDIQYEGPEKTFDTGVGTFEDFVKAFRTIR